MQSADSLLKILTLHHSSFDEEHLFIQMTTQFVQKYPTSFWMRSTLEGHLTGSAWVLNPTKEKALLIHHLGLDRWFQPGGHAEDDDSTLMHTALREAQEECGLQKLHILSNNIFDLDIHVIPRKKDIPEHLHYDVRFIFCAETEVVSFDKSEIRDLRWVPIRELTHTNVQQAIRRMALKSF
jgi:8-oxo-dGTP pyrophosphatase MutT (NUDIX family)